MAKQLTSKKNTPLRQGSAGQADSIVRSTSVKTPVYLIKAEVSPSLIAQAIQTLLKRTRVRRAHTKTRKEVRGGGRKPWAQKHTGRARHASIRSPIWVGGGTVFGPRVRKTRIVEMPERMNRAALRGALALHAQGKTLEVVSVNVPAQLKTSAVSASLVGRGLLLVLTTEKKAIIRAVRNLPNAKAVLVGQLTARDVVNANRVLVDEAALPALEKRCRK